MMLTLSSCQTYSEIISKKSRFSTLWTSEEVANDASLHQQEADNPNLQQNMTEPSFNNPDGEDPNRLLVQTDSSGNREFLLLPSIKKDNQAIVALIEYRYAQPQKHPNGLMYTHNHWFEQIDCQNKIRTIRTTTHYNHVGQVVDANEYPVPKYTPDQIKLLAQPNDGVIREVCQRMGANPPENTPQTVSNSNPVVSGISGATGTGTASTTPQSASDVTTPTQAVSNNPLNQQVNQQENAAVVPTPDNAKNSKNAKNAKNKKDKLKKQNNNQEKEKEVTTPNEIDFIQKSNPVPADGTSDANPKKSESSSEIKAIKANDSGNTEKNLPKQENKKENKEAEMGRVLQPKQDDLPPDFWTIGMPQ